MNAPGGGNFSRGSLVLGGSATGEKIVVVVVAVVIGGGVLGPVILRAATPSSAS